MIEMPSPIPVVPCQCTGSGWVDEETGCICGVSERVLRSGAALTSEQRAWCIAEVRKCGDATNQPTDTEFSSMSDADLGRETLSAWADYCRDKGML